MSNKAIDWAYAQKDIKGGCKSVLVALANRANKDDECWPEIDTIAEDTGIGSSTVSGHLKKLTKLGKITKEKRHNERGYRKSSLYKLNRNLSGDFQSRKNQRTDLQNQSPDFPQSKVQNLEGNIVETKIEPKEETKCEVKTSPSSGLSKDVQEIFEHWQKVMNHPHAKLEPKRKGRITQALKHYTVEQLKQAIDGCASSDFHMGVNDQKKRYDSISLIFRDSEKIDQFISYQIDSLTTNTKPSYSLMAGVGHE